MRKSPKTLSKEAGSGFLMVILLTLVVTVLGTAMMIMSDTDHLIAANERDSERALHTSKAGLQYAYYLFMQGLLNPTITGANFDSTDAAVREPLDGGSFSGAIYDMSATIGRGQLYRIESTGSFNRASRTTEVVVEIVPDAFKYGYMGFDEVTLHNHSGLAGPAFRVESTTFSNGNVSVPDGITLDGAVVAGGTADISGTAVVKRDVFANDVSNDGTIEGDAKALCAVEDLPMGAATWDLKDSFGTKYNWYNGASTPGSVGGGGTIVGTSSTYQITDGEEFKRDIFRRDGKLLSDPDLNVISFIGPPLIDYKAMKAEADKFDPTYFQTQDEAMAYFASKIVSETIDGKTVLTAKVGTEVFPEFIYIRDDLALDLDPTLGTPWSGDTLRADGFNLEGGIFVTGSLELSGPPYDPLVHPSPPNWYQYRINALPYCLPALTAYEEPGTGTIATWTPADTPPAGGGGSFKMSSGSPWAGFTYVAGVTYSQADTHLHHTASANELIRFIGAELAFKIHNCDYFWFTYDPAIRCTQFLIADGGSPEVISYREIR